MTQHEIRRLLGGYATNTLSERERAALFEAALEDQELFNALQEEEALRELLDDPATREPLRAELRPKPRRWTWLFAAAGVAAAAAVAIGIVYWPRQAAHKSAPVQIASVKARQNPVAPKIEQPAPEAPPTARPAPTRKRRIPVAAPRASAQLSRVGGLLAPGPAPVTLGASIAATAPLYTGPLVRYSVLRSGPEGDQIRIEVVSQFAGELALYRANGPGQWQRIYPSNTPAVAIAPDQPYQIPDAPIRMRGNENKLRLVVDPIEPRFRTQLADSFVEQRATAGTGAKPAPRPLVIEIPIGPN